MVGTPALENRKKRLNICLEIIKKNSPIQKKKLLAKLNLELGLTDTIANEYLQTLHDADLIIISYHKDQVRFKR